jgi:hypothetical protein
MHKEMVGLIIETPLTEDDTGSGILTFLHHIDEVLLLHIIQFLVILSALNFETVLGLWLWWLEWASQNKDLSILDFLLHLWMREVLVKDDTLDELTVLESTTGLGDDLDEVEVNVLSLEIGDMEHGLKGQVGVVSLALGDNLGSKSGHCALSKILVIVLGNVNLLLNLIELLHSDVTSSLEAVSNLQWVDSLVEELLGLLENGASKDNDTSSSISDFIILGSRELNQEFGGLMMDLHLLKDGGAIVGDDDLSIWTNEHLVHSLWSEGSLEEGGNGSCSQDVNLVGLESLNSLLFALLSQDDERAA